MLTCAPLTTPFGEMLLAADAHGLTNLCLPGETLDPADLVRVHPADHPLLAEAARQVQAYLAGRLQNFDLPLALAGTPFRLRVWAELQTIPYGRTLSYGELAERLGSRARARAVGGAAHANPVAIIVPCHRLIGANGSLTGFGGGLPLKQALLDLERDHPGPERRP